MILEVAILDIIPGREQAFEQAFKTAQLIIGSMTGYIDHELKRCLEKPADISCWSTGKR